MSRPRRSHRKKPKAERSVKDLADALAEARRQLETEIQTRKQAEEQLETEAAEKTDAEERADSLGRSAC